MKVAKTFLPKVANKVLDSDADVEVTIWLFRDQGELKIVGDMTSNQLTNILFQVTQRHDDYTIIVSGDTLKVVVEPDLS